MFSGIGGFRAGLSSVDGFHCVGHCEIDKYANKSYQSIFNTEGEYFCNDAREINPNELPDFELLCAGFPCQSFSQAGRRRGFDDTRGTLFFEIARLVREKRPEYLLLENVPGLLTHDKGRTFSTILGTLSELRYHVEWQVLDSKNFGVPQSRKRVYAFCYLDKRCAGKVLPIIRENSQTLKQLIGGRQGQRVYDVNGLSCTLTSGGGGFAGKSGLYYIEVNNSPKITDGTPIPLLTLERLKKMQNGNKYCSPNSPMNTFTQQEWHDILLNGRIRKLLPIECLRLQGYDDEQIAKITAVNSDNQVYRQAGNSVTVNVVQEIGLRIANIGLDYLTKKV